MFEALRTLIKGRRSLSELDHSVLAAVRSQLDPSEQARWDQQIASICMVIRTPEGLEVELCRAADFKERGKQSFKGHFGETLLAVVTVCYGDNSLNAHIWCVDGEVFSIEYDDYLAAKRLTKHVRVRKEVQLSCQLQAISSKLESLA